MPALLCILMNYKSDKQNLYWQVTSASVVKKMCFSSSTALNQLISLISWTPGFVLLIRRSTLLTGNTGGDFLNLELPLLPNSAYSRPVQLIAQGSNVAHLLMHAGPVNPFEGKQYTVVVFIPEIPVVQKTPANNNHVTLQKQYAFFFFVLLV